MKMSKDLQKSILLEGFEALKNDYEENYSEISEIIGKISAIDVEIAMDMWEYILTSNPKFITNNEGYINDNKAYDITSSVLYHINDNIGYAEASEAIRNRPKIKEAIFKKSANVDGNQCSIITQYILNGNLETANEILQFVNSNKYNKGKGFSLSIGGIFQEIIKGINSNKDDNVIGFIHNWIQQINDPKEKAKANVKFLDLLK